MTVALLTVLRVSFTSLLSSPTVQAEVKSFRADSPLTAEGEHYRLFPLTPFTPQQSFETYYFEIDPGTVFHGEPHRGNVYEYSFFNQGETADHCSKGRVQHPCGGVPAVSGGSSA